MAGHQRYVARMRPVLAERKGAPGAACAWLCCAEGATPAGLPRSQRRVLSTAGDVLVLGLAPGPTAHPLPSPRQPSSVLWPPADALDEVKRMTELQVQHSFTHGATTMVSGEQRRGWGRGAAALQVGAARLRRAAGRRPMRPRAPRAPRTRAKAAARRADPPLPAPAAPSAQSFVECTTRLSEATGLVMQTVSAQHAAYCELLIGGWLPSFWWLAAGRRGPAPVGTRACLPSHIL